MILISAVAMPALFLWREQALLFFALVFVVYWCYGTQLSVFASTTADFYGTKNLGLNYGVLFTAWGAAGILGPFDRRPGLRGIRRLPGGVLHGRRPRARRLRVAVDGQGADEIRPDRRHVAAVLATAG